MEKFWYDMSVMETIDFLRSYSLDDFTLMHGCERLLDFKETKYADDVSYALVNVLSDSGYERIALMLCDFKGKQDTNFLLDVWETALKYDENVNIATYDNLCEVAAIRPELNSRIMDLVKIQPFGKDETQIQSDIKVKQELLKAKQMIINPKETTQSIKESTPSKPNGRSGNGGHEDGR